MATIDLYHRTGSEQAKRIMNERRMVSLEVPALVYFSTRSDGQATGYGDTVVHVRVPEDSARLDDEFPDGEQHYAVLADVLRPEHFIDVIPS